MFCVIYDICVYLYSLPFYTIMYKKEEKQKRSKKEEPEKNCLLSFLHWLGIIPSNLINKAAKFSVPLTVDIINGDRISPYLFKSDFLRLKRQAKKPTKLEKFRSRWPKKMQIAVHYAWKN